MRMKEPMIHNEDMLAKIIGASALLIWLKDGIAIVAVLWIWFFICECVERKNYKRTQAKRDEINNRKYY